MSKNTGTDPLDMAPYDELEEPKPLKSPTVSVDSAYNYEIDQSVHYKNV